MNAPADTRRVFSLLSLLSSLCPLCLCGSSSAASELKEPYRLQVVVRVADNRLLTDVFKKQLRRELGDGLRAACGPLARVEVTDKHPRLAEIDERGLQALDSWREVTGVKTHFVLIDFADGQYVIQARQHDGLTGLASPVVRRRRTPDRQFVARAAALLIDRDFGPVGTVVEKGDGTTVKVELHGGGLGVGLGRWVKKGEIFLLAAVVPGGGGERSVPVRWAVLRAEDAPKDGALTCQLFRRHRDPFAAGGTFRCLHVATVKAPLRLRFVEAGARTPTPRSNLLVQVQRHSFGDDEPGREQGTTDLDGYFQADRDKPFDHLAFVKVMEGGRAVARIPVALVDDRPVSIPISIKAETAAPLQTRRRFWLQHLYEALEVNQQLFKELNALARKPDQRQAALDRARKGLDNMKATIEQLLKEQGNLEKMAKEQGTPLDLKDGRQRFKELEKDRDDLQELIESQEKVLAKENDPRRRELLGMVEQGKALEKDFEVGQALELYRKANAELKDEELKKRIEKLEGVWKPQSAAHAEARKFIYGPWGEFDAAKMKERIQEAQKALKTCEGVKDTLGVQKLLRVAVGHVARLRAQLNALAPDVNEDDRKPAEELAGTLDDMNRLITDASAYLEKMLPGGR